MRTSTTQYAAALKTGSDTEPVSKISVAWPAAIAGALAAYTDITESFQSHTGQAALTTDMPQGTRLVEGYPARSMTLVLGGRLTKTSDQTKTAAWLFDPWSQTSPLYGTDWSGVTGAVITVQEGLQLPTFAAPELFTIGTFTVDNILVNRSTGDVTLNLIDNRFLLSVPAEIPGAITYTSWQAGTAGAPILTPGLQASWAIDNVLRNAGIYTSPPARPNCVAHVSLHGSLWPEIAGQMTVANTMLIGQWPGGVANSGQPTTPAWQPGRYVAETPQQATVQFPITYPLYMDARNAFMVEGWVFCDPTSGVAGGVNVELQDASGNGSTLTLYLTQTATGQLTVAFDTIRNATPNYVIMNATNVPGVTSGWHQISVAYTFTSNAQVSAAVYVDRALWTTATLGGIADLASTAMTQIFISQASGFTDGTPRGFATEAWQVFLDPSQTPSPVYPQQAQLDASLNSLTAIPDLSSSDGWAVIQGICDAEGATAGFDEDLIFRFKNRYNRYSATAQATITSLNRIKDLQVEVNEANRARTVTANAFPLNIGNPGIVWSASQTYVIPAMGQIVILATLNQPTVFVPWAFTKIPSGGPTNFALNGFRAAFKADGTGGAATSGLYIVTSVISSTLVKITAKNPHNQPVYLVSAVGDGPAASNGQPALTLSGIPVTPATSVDASAAASGAVQVQSVWQGGQPALTLPDNPWRQDTDTTQQFTDETMQDLYRPKPMITMFTIVGDSRLQLGDRVTIQDQGSYVDGGWGPGAVLGDDAILTTINPSRSATGGFTQQCIARVVSRPGAWMLGVVGHSELGSTTPA